MRLPSYLLAAYFVCTALIAIWSHHRQRTSDDFLNETGNLPTWVATLSFLAANCGALEIVGLTGIAARYGVHAFHFYWIGAIPALVFVSFVVLPTYHRSGVKSVPEFLGMRFGREVRLLNAAVLLGGTCLTAGVSLHAVSEILHLFAGWRFIICILVTAAIAITNILTGGLRGTMRTEILHFFLMVAGLSPMLYLSFRFGEHHPNTDTTWAHLWRNIKVPGEMSVVGFDDIHLAEFANPPLTTVRLSHEELAQKAFNAIQQIINSDAETTPSPIRVGASLIVRESTDFHTEAAHGLHIKRRETRTAV